MANNLNRNLKKGDKILMDNDAKGVLVIVASDSTFGAKSYTRGTALWVTVPSMGNQEMRVEGDEILAEATMQKYGKENGWLDEAGNIKAEANAPA